MCVGGVVASMANRRGASTSHVMITEQPRSPRCCNLLSAAGGQAGSAAGSAESGTQQVVTKLLVSNPIAGSVIGKSGKTTGASTRRSTGPASPLATTAWMQPRA